MSNVRVAIRVRPLTKREEAQGAKVIVGIERERLLVTNLKVPVNKEHDSRARTRQFGFDFCYWSVDAKSQHFASQEMIYEDIGSKVLEAVFEGFNACVLAYGQSGSGKTFTMMGQNGELGLTPRICQGLFDRIMKVTDKQLTFRTEVSFLEIYNERVGDLLRPPTCSKQQRRRPTLRVREHPKLGPCVQDLSKHVVNDFNGVQALIERGLQNRSVAATRMHDHSSRSHAIFTINFIQAKLDEDLPSEVVSKIHLVDLAGSERATVGMNKIRLKEGANINKSLVALGSVICALAEKSMSLWSLDSLSSSKSHTSSTGDSFSTSSTSPLGSSSHRGHTPFVPYRDSVLTWLLKDSLGGNSKTIMVATISPASTAYNETLSTLRYAQRAKCIVNKPIINEDPNVKLIRELKAEIARLRELLSTTKQNGIMKFSGEHSLPVSEIITRNQDKAQELTRCWIEKWHYFQRQAQETICNTCSTKANMAGMIDSNTPYLFGGLNLFSDGVQIVCLKDGETVVSNCSDSDKVGLSESLSLPSSDTSKCRLCDSDMLSDQNDDSSGPILKSLLSDSDESSESEPSFYKKSVLSKTNIDDKKGTIESMDVVCSAIATAAAVSDGFDEETIDDDFWSDTDDFSFYAFNDQEEDLQLEESVATNCNTSEVADVAADAHSEKLRHLIRYLSPIEECPSSQSQSPVLLPEKAVEVAEMSQHCNNDRAEHSKDIETEHLQCRDFSIDIDLDSLDENKSESVSPKYTQKQHKMLESQETTFNTKQSDSVPSFPQKLSCYHIGFVSSDDISDMDTDVDVVPSISAKPLDISKMNSTNVPFRRPSLDARSKKQTYYVVSNRSNCLSSSSSDDDTSHSHNSSHMGNTYQSTRQQKFQRILMENRRKRRHKKTSPKKDFTTKLHIYCDHSRSSAEKNLRTSSKQMYPNEEKTISPLPLPQPSFLKQRETLSLSSKIISNKKLAESADEDSKLHDIKTNFNIPHPPIDIASNGTKSSSLNLLDCSFTTDSLENLSSRCPSQNECLVQHPNTSSCWTYKYEKIEPRVENFTLKKHARRSAFKHSWPSCDSLTMVYMGPEWGSTETNLVASIQSLEDQDFYSSDRGFTSENIKNDNGGAKYVLKKAFSDSCLFTKWAEVASSSLSVPEVPFTLSESEAPNLQCQLIVHDQQIQSNVKEDMQKVGEPLQETTSKILLQTIATSEIDNNLVCEGPEGLKHLSDDAGGCSQNVTVVKELWNSQERYVDGAWIPLASFYSNNYQIDHHHLDENQDELSFCENSSVKTEKQSVCTCRIVGTKTETSSDSGFQTEVTTNHIPLENASSQTTKVTRESFCQTSMLSNVTCVQTDPICFMMSTQTDPILRDNGSQTEHRVSEYIQTVPLYQLQDGFSQTDYTLCKEATMQTSLETVADIATSFKHANQNEFLDTFEVSDGKQFLDGADKIEAIRDLVTDSSTSSSAEVKPTYEAINCKDLKSYDSGIFIGFYGKNNQVQNLSIRFNSNNSKCLSRDEVECHTNDIIAFPRGETGDTVYHQSVVACSPEESSVCNQVTSSLDNFHDEKDLDVDLTVSDYSNDVTVSYPRCPLAVSTSTIFLKNGDVSTTPEIMDNDSCNEDVLQRETLCDVFDVQNQKYENPVLDKFQSSDSTKELDVVAEHKQCFDTSETSCTSFTQTDFNDFFQINNLKAFLYSSLGCGNGQLDFSQFDFFTEMQSRIKALEVQCSEILMEQQKCSIHYEKYMKKKVSVERPRKKTVEWRQSLREKQKLVFEERVKKHVRELYYENDEDYYKLPNTLKLKCNYMQKRKKLCCGESSKQIEEVAVTKTNFVTELPSSIEISEVCPEEKGCFSEEILKNIDPLLPFSGVPDENTLQINEPVSKEVAKSIENISVVTGTSKEVSTLECHMQKTLKCYFKEEDSEEDYGNNIPEDILALLRECKAVRKRAWVEINLAHQQLGY